MPLNLIYNSCDILLHQKKKKKSLNKLLLQKKKGNERRENRVNILPLTESIHVSIRPIH